MISGQWLVRRTAALSIGLVDFVDLVGRRPRRTAAQRNENSVSLCLCVRNNTWWLRQWRGDRPTGPPSAPSCFGKQPGHLVKTTFPCFAAPTGAAASADAGDGSMRISVSSRFDSRIAASPCHGADTRRAGGIRPRGVTSPLRDGAKARKCTGFYAVSGPQNGDCPDAVETGLQKFRLHLIFPWCKKTRNAHLGSERKAPCPIP